jgi:hypothetical protein
MINRATHNERKAIEEEEEENKLFISCNKNNIYFYNYF